MKKLLGICTLLFITTTVFGAEEKEPYTFCPIVMDGYCSYFERESLDHIETVKKGNEFFIKVIDKAGYSQEIPFGKYSEDMYKYFDKNVIKIFEDSHYSYCWKDADKLWDKTKEYRTNYYIY